MIYTNNGRLLFFWINNATGSCFLFVYVITLGLAGGADAKDTVWRILKQAIKNDLAKNISWRGMNGKISFENLHLKAVVMGKHFNCSSMFIKSILF